VFAAGLWIIEAADLDVSLKLMSEGSKACNRRLNRAIAVGAEIAYLTRRRNAAGSD